MLDLQPISVSRLPWEEVDDICYRAVLPLFGSLRVERYCGDFWTCSWSVPGTCDTFVDGHFSTAEEAMAAAQKEYDARILSVVSNDNPGIPEPDLKVADWMKFIPAPHPDPAQAAPKHALSDAQACAEGLLLALQDWPETDSTFPEMVQRAWQEMRDSDDIPASFMAALEVFAESKPITQEDV